jgi:glucose/arabinose dehydrogenase
MAFLLALTACTSDTGTNPAPPPPPPPPAPPPPPPSGEFSLTTETVATGLTRPLYLTAPTGDDRLFIVEQTGRIRIVKNGDVSAAPFLDLSSKVSGSGEQGLLSMAFHPDYGANGLFYVNFTGNDGNTRVERYAVSADPDVADGGSAKLILTVPQPASNHNGGHILFGPDGMLYVALGDGGGAGDPFNNGQNSGTLLGSLLRLDVDGGDPYAIPSDNPFGNEIWAIGLRNPWRIAFDPGEGRLYIADVGQASFEEVNVVDNDESDLNYGWRIMEGSSCFGGGGCDDAGLVLPEVEYDHGEGCSVTGGFVYRGSALPEIVGHYFYSDFCRGFLRSFRFDGEDATELVDWDVGGLGSVLSFGQDAAGELYILSGDGRVVKLVRAP